MANSYSVQASDGSHYTVSNDERHDDSTNDAAFKKHLEGLFTGVVVSIISFALLDGADGSC